VPDVPLPPALAPVAFLVGRWKGRGAGSYPTIQDFTYGEEVEFRHGPKPFLAYTQRTWDLETFAPMHVESGYLRVSGPPEGTPDGPVGIEMVVSQPTGIVEVLTGTLDGQTLLLATTTVALTPTAKEVSAVDRELRLEAGELVGRLAMAAVGRPLTHHLASRLVRQID
jgi:hypothetical protein